VRRGKAVAVAAAAVALFATGCGVQPTGVNIAQTEPFGESPSSSPQSVSPSQYPYTVSVFLISSINKGPGTMINRPVATAPSLADLPNQLAQLSADEQVQQYTTYVPPGVTIKPGDQAHEFYVSSPTRLGTLAQQQLYCTFDQWWIQHRDNRNPSTRLIFTDTGEDTGWQDCPEGVVLDAGGAAGAGVAKPSVPATSRALTGN
jgi:hypothetical protein